MNSSDRWTRSRALVMTASILGTPLVLLAALSLPVSAGTPGTVTPAAEPSAPVQAFDINNRHSNLQSPINSANVAQMHLGWMIPMPAPVSHTPLVENGRLYTADWDGNAYAIDTTSGQIVWRKQLEGPRHDWAWYGFAGTGALSEDTLFEASVEGNAFALDKSTVEIKWQTHFTDQPTAGNIGTLLYNDGLLYVGLSSVEEALSQQPGFQPSFRGAVMALDASNGTVVWQRSLVDAPQNGVAIWSGFALDPAMNALFFSTGNNYTGNASPLSDSVVAVNAKTGEILWSKQVVQNDVWTLGHPVGPDWDFSGGPQLFEASVNGQVRQLLGAASKSGMFWTFDRRTGEIVWATSISAGGTQGGMHGEASIGLDRILAWGNDAFSGQQPDQHPMNIRALDPATGKVLWSVDKAQPPALKAPGFLVNDVYLMGSLDGKIRAYGAGDGKLLWTSDQQGSIASALLVQGDSLYFSTGVPKIFGDNGLGNGVVGYTTNPQIGAVVGTGTTTTPPAGGTQPGY